MKTRNKSIVERFIAGLVGTLLMSMTMLASAEIAIPSAPLGVTMSATPMTLLVASKDHRLFYEAYNDASDVDGDGTLDIRFKPSITYYGLFDSNVCYTYSSDLFSPASAASNGKCSGSDEWSGNWLNYVTTSRIDALRKVLYGGYREIDTTTETVLRRAYIPQDAHSWAKEYTSLAIDGYSISDYTPLSSPAANKRHFFGNLTPNENTNCSTLNTCSNLLPLLSVVTNSTKRVWAWASKERPVLDGSHGGTRNDYAVRVKVCTANFHEDCKQYPNGNYKPTGILHDYGEDNTMLFGLLTGSYNKNMSGGVLRKVISSFANEVNSNTGQFTENNTIVHSFDSLRIRDYNNTRTDKAYRKGWVTTKTMKEADFVDWGNPVGEMMYEGLRYFAGKKLATSDFAASGSYDADVGLPVATWDDPYKSGSAAEAYFCAKPNMIVISDTNVSFDSDQLPGSDFNSFSGDLSGLNVTTEANTITNNETDITGMRFIGQSGSQYDAAPTAKTVTSLGSIRGLAPEEPTKQGSYYSASVAYFGKRSDLRTDLSDSGARQSTDTYTVALSSPLPKIAAKLSSGAVINVIPFAKSVGGNSIEYAKNKFQPTNQIVDFYVESIANSGENDADPNINDGRYEAIFRVNYEDVEQGADHDMDVIAQYKIKALADNTLEIKVETTYQAGGIQQNVGYIISGTTQDGVYLVAQDENVQIPYFLNVPPNRDPGYCDVSSPPEDCNTLPCATGSCSTKSESTRIFNPGASTATLLKDPLWYAAKWGGFIDKNKNDLPDLDYEWDADNDGVPDTYFLVQNPLKLEEALKRALDNIVDRTASASNVTSNSTQLNTDTLIFQSTFNSVTWSGDLLAYTIDSVTGVSDSPSWSASENVPAPSSRRIFITGSNGETTAFSWSNLSASDKTALINEDVLNYLRGSRSDEQQNGGTLRDRAYSNVLGDFVHSSPVYVKDTETVYLGGNDGMLHAFNALNNTNGAELFAYIPSAVIGKLEQITRVNYNHQYFVDGEIVVSDRSQTNDSNYLVAALGHGGKGLFALDVTNPESFSASDVKWSYFDTSDDDLGYMIGRPVIAKMNNGDWAVIVGNGYNSTDGKAVLYIFDLVSGDLLQKIDTDVSGDNGLASPGIYDADYDGVVDFIYAGDLKGNVWKFNVTSENKNSWGSALRQGSKAKPLFTATDPSGNPQPITAQITIVPNHDRADAINYGNRFIFFGTGSYFRASDPNDEQIQSWYGLIDENAQISGRSALMQRSIHQTGTFDGKSVRTFSQATLGDMSGKKGWYLDFNTEAGERIVTSSNYYEFAEPVLFASSIIPIEDPCVSGGKGYINAISPFTGGRLTYAILDINKNQNFDDDKLNNIFIGSIDPDIGMPGESIVVYSPGKPPKLITTGSDPDKKSDEDIYDPNTTTTEERSSWREITTE